MKKLQLDVDSLCVESFEARTEFDLRAGTVRAYSSHPDICTPAVTDDPGAYSCGGQQSCNGSCNCGSAGCGSNGCATAGGPTCTPIDLSCQGLCVSDFC
jgi:hypothetical protein